MLFLDFDGVTHPYPCSIGDEFCCLPHIEEVLLQHPEVEVVISSSWREMYSLEYLQGFFSADIAARIRGVTRYSKNMMETWSPGSGYRTQRESQCKAWIRFNRPRDTPWMALDDGAHRFSSNCANLLLTTSATGFTQAHQQTLKDMIRERFRAPK